MFIRDECGIDGYEKTVGSVFPIIDIMLYDQREQVRDKSIQVLIESRNVVD